MLRKQTIHVFTMWSSLCIFSSNLPVVAVFSILFLIVTRKKHCYALRLVSVINLFLLFLNGISCSILYSSMIFFASAASGRVWDRTYDRLVICCMWSVACDHACDLLHVIVHVICCMWSSCDLLRLIEFVHCCMWSCMWFVAFDRFCALLHVIVQVICCIWLNSCAVACDRLVICCTCSSSCTVVCNFGLMTLVCRVLGSI